ERWYKLGGESRQITDDDLITADAVLAKKRLETTLYNLGTKAVEWEIGTERFPDQYERCTLCTEKNRVETLYKYGKLIFASHLVDHNPDVAGIVNALWTALDKIAADCDLPKPSRKKPEAALQMVAKCRWRDQDNIIQNRTDVEFHQAVYKARASGLTYESDTVGLVEGLRLLGEAAFNKKIGAEQFPEQYPQDWLISESGQKDVHEEYGNLIFKSHAFDDEPAVAAEIQDVQRVLSDIRNPVDNVADNLADNDEPAVAAEIQADKIPSLTVGNVADNDKQNAVSERKGKNNVWALGIGGSTVWFIIAVIYVIVKVFFFRK
ncbi:MAG: hypothetical protein LBT89_01415, partial [Planctomycetaceae bacterium]|nr:hypothetical protein [Planctomycetaceae bacterium]